MQQINNGNYKFTNEITKFKVEKIAKVIVDKYNKRLERLNNVINNGNGALQVDLVNVNSYLIK